MRDHLSNADAREERLGRGLQYMAENQCEEIAGAGQVRGSRVGLAVNQRVGR